MTITLNGTTGITNDGGYTGDGVVFADTTPANTLVTTTAGNVGIGTSSPQSLLDVRGNGYFNSLRLNGANTTDTVFQSTGDLGIAAASASNILLRTNNAERARIDSSGNLQLGTTSGIGNTRLNVVPSGTNNAAAFAYSSTNEAINIYNTGNQGYTAIRFLNNAFATVVGTIACSTTATAYNTSSDYRLKNTVAPMTGALARIAALKPVTYKWNADGSDGEGFIAHELAEVVPDAVTGEKDAVNEDGSIKPQGIDTSFLVATLTAAIQEQQAIITALTARVTALEGQA